MYLYFYFPLEAIFPIWFYIIFTFRTASNFHFGINLIVPVIYFRLFLSFSSFLIPLLSFSALRWYGFSIAFIFLCSCLVCWKLIFYVSDSYIVYLFLIIFWNNVLYYFWIFNWFLLIKQETQIQVHIDIVQKWDKTNHQSEKIENFPPMGQNEIVYECTMYYWYWLK